jgi:hypothetical protein
MQVQVKHGVTGAGADVEHCAVAILDTALAPNPRSNEIAISDDLGIFGLSLLEADNVLLGNDEHMRGRLRADVFEGEDLVVFIHLLGRDLARNNLAKEAVWIHGISVLEISTSW